MSAVAAVCLLASSADAAIDADFNGDGVLDRVVLPRPPETNIVVRLSGGPPQVLKFHDQVISIVATDIDHDGKIDLSALSERRGVFIWLNKGQPTNGHLKALKRRRHNRGFSLSSRGPLASAPESSTDGPVATGTQDDRDRSAYHLRLTYELNERPALHKPSSLIPTLPDAPDGTSPSRAPPSAL